MMSALDPNPAPASPTAMPRAGTSVVRAALLASLAVICLAVTFWNYALEMRFNVFRTSTLLVFLIGGTGATLYLALAMQSLIALLRDPALSFPSRFLLQSANRFLLLFQLVATGVFVFALGVIVLGWAIPGTYHEVLHPGWTPPPEEQEEPVPASFRTRAGGLFRSITPTMP